MGCLHYKVFITHYYVIITQNSQSLSLPIITHFSLPNLQVMLLAVPEVNPECRWFLYVDKKAITGDVLSTLLSLLYSLAWLELCQDRRCAAACCVQILLMQTDRLCNHRAPSATSSCYSMLWVSPCSQCTWTTAMLCYECTSQARMFQNSLGHEP